MLLLYKKLFYKYVHILLKGNILLFQLLHLKKKILILLLMVLLTNLNNDLNIKNKMLLFRHDNFLLNLLYI